MRSSACPGSEIARQFDAIADFSGVERFLDTPVKRYSSGMYVRLAFAVAAHLQSEIPPRGRGARGGGRGVPEEVHGEDAGRLPKGRTVLFVSHNMGAVNNLTRSAIFMQDGQLALAGTTPDVVRAYLDSELPARHRVDRSRTEGHSRAVPACGDLQAGRGRRGNFYRVRRPCRDGRVRGPAARSRSDRRRHSPRGRQGFCANSRTSTRCPSSSRPDSPAGIALR